MKELNSVFEKLNASNDAGLRYVLDIGKTLTEEAFSACAEMDPPDFEKGKPEPTYAELLATFKQFSLHIAYFTLGLVMGMLITRTVAFSKD